MSTVRIEELKPGLIVAQDVKTPDGRVILAKGARVEAFHPQLLKGLGIAEVVAESSDQDKLLEQAADYAREYFSYGNPDSPVLAELYRYATRLVAERLAQGWVPPSMSERMAQNVEHLSDVLPAGEATAEQIVRHETDLASFPEVSLRLKAEVESPKATITTLAQLISQDMSLSAKLLKLANSPLYNFSEPVESIQRAVTMIGLREVSTLALGVTTINYFQGIPPELVDMKSFWRHSISCGIFAKTLVQSMTGGLNPERFFISGLLHDVGRLIMFKKLPYASTEALLYARENFVPVVVAEAALIGYDHTEVSRLLLASWKFPAMLSDLINFHHDPLAAPEPRLAAVIHLADAMSNAVEVGAGRHYVMPDIDEQAFALLGLPANGLAQVFSAYETQAEQTISAFF
jgi:HD-like signal output (HDOD) protein